MEGVCLGKTTQLERQEIADMSEQGKEALSLKSTDQNYAVSSGQASPNVVQMQDLTAPLEELYRVNYKGYIIIECT